MFGNIPETVSKLTKMETLIKVKLKKSDDQTNIDKYRVVANITDHHIISKLIPVERILFC